VGFAKFLDLTGRYQTYFVPLDGDVGILGTIESVTYGITGAGLIRTDADQTVPGSGWAAAPSSGGCDGIPYGNPLRLQYSGQGTFSAGQRVRFDVIAAPYGVQAVNVTAL
jgi:hypothetical protein